MFQGGREQRCRSRRPDRTHYGGHDLGDAVHRAQHATVGSQGCCEEEDRPEGHVHDAQQYVLEPDHRPHDPRQPVGARVEAHDRVQREERHEHREPELEDTLRAPGVDDAREEERLGDAVKEPDGAEDRADRWRLEAEAAEGDGCGEEEGHEDEEGHLHEREGAVVCDGDDDGPSADGAERRGAIVLVACGHGC